MKWAHLDKKYVTLEKDGIPLAGVMDIDELEDYLEIKDPKPKVRTTIAKSRQEFRAVKTGRRERSSATAEDAGQAPRG